MPDQGRHTEATAGEESVARVATSPDEDRLLARRAAGGDVAAFAAIMRRHNRALYRTARSITRDDADAEDAVQEAYLRAHRSLAGFREDSTLRTWLTRIVINEALQQLRKRRRERATTTSDNIVNIEARLDPLRFEECCADTPERAAMRAQARRLIEQKVDGLPSAFRTVFVMRAIEGLSAEETAEALGVPVATVRTRFFRARGLLQKSIDTELGPALGDAFAFDGARCDRIVESVLARLAPRKEEP